MFVYGLIVNLWTNTLQLMTQLLKISLYVGMRDFNRPACNRYKAKSVKVMVSQYSIARSERNQKTQAQTRLC